MKKIFFLITMVMVIFAEAKCVSGNCINGEGIELIEDYVYIGTFKNSKRDGSGLLKKGDEEFYILYNGEFKNGEPFGHGISYIHNTTSEPYFVGEFVGLLKFKPGSSLLIKQNKYADAYYKVSEFRKDGSQNMHVLKEKTADLICSQHPSEFMCIQRAMNKNKTAIMTMIGLGYLNAVFSTDEKNKHQTNHSTEIDFKQVQKSLKVLSKYMIKKETESIEVYVKRLNIKIIQAQRVSTINITSTTIKHTR